MIIIVAIISYCRSHHRNRFQKLLAIYLKFKGVSAKGFDTLHGMGLTMSHKWTCDVVERISESCIKTVKKMINEIPSTLSYDNMQVSFRVFSQRLDNQNEFGNGTAATIYFHSNAHALPKDANQQLRKQRAQGQKRSLTANDILNLAETSMSRLRPFAIHTILQFLLDSPEFDFKTYGAKRSDRFKPPVPLNALPCGREHRTLQYLLASVNIPEASYDDNEKLIKEWLRQLGWSSPAEQKKTGTERIIVCCGDQLTMDRLRGLYKHHARDGNSFERLDFLVCVFGWLHLMMAFGNSLYKQYFGTPQGRGLQQAFILLQKKGLSRIQTKGPFHHDLEETLYEIAEAHFLEDWLEVTKKENITDLRSYSPAELVTFATRILDERASSLALNTMHRRNTKERDEQLEQIIMWNRDILEYIILDHAIESGDVGIMEDMLPHLFLRFLGGGSGKYAGEVLELMQSLHREWPPEIW